MNTPFDNESLAWAWATGIFEGEGHISYGQYTKRHQAHPAYRRALVMGMTDEDTVRRFHKVVGCGTVAHKAPPADKPEWKDFWRWQCASRADIAHVLSHMLPMLGERRSAKALELLANPARYGNERNKSHCLKGHPLSGENLYESGGRRHCRECRREHSRRYEAANREKRNSPRRGKV